ncbi:MAG: sigma-70 family RNA polymerase sigma factor [Bryobacteraceae bacterium]|nr:sigma-70 family RNA polymerase sigma factor [Bryobacteraceae bacterium]
MLERVRERIVAFAASRLGRDSAEDLAQEVLLVLHTKYSHLHALEDLLPLSFQILRYKMMTATRKSFRHGEPNNLSPDDIALPDSRPDPESRAQRQQRLERLAAALRQLGERCRRIFLLKLEGQSFPEIQQRLEVDSINTVYTWDFRCRKQLLEILGGSWDPALAPKEKVQ